MDIKKWKIAIIGAGSAGQILADEINTKGIIGEIACFIDDDSAKIGTSINGIPVLGPVSNIEEIKKNQNTDEALIAIPSASKIKIKEIYQTLKKANFGRILILPGISQIIDGSAHLVQTREISALDLLGRTPVVIPLKKSLEYLKGKRVLITGAGGSIGSELSRQLLSGNIARLYLFGHGENSIYEIDKELRILQKEGVGEKTTIIPIIGDLQDMNYSKFILKRTKPDVIFHCAAYKHVPMMEANPVEAIKNNVFCTKNLVEAAVETKVGKFILISTDKAVEPIGVYGASKYICEEIVLSQKNKNNFIVVRFGNVLGSRGSILPLFNQQVQNGGPVTITHPQIQRYFMTIPEAASLVLKTAGTEEKGNMFILDMGEPVLIKDIAEQIISFYGFIPEKDIPIIYTGIRPGEKFTEKLWQDGETVKESETPRVNILMNRKSIGKKLKDLLEELRAVCYYDPEKPDKFRNKLLLRKILKQYIPTVERPENEEKY